MPAEFRPTRGMSAAAARALEQRRELPPSRRGMTPVGLARARDLVNGRTLSEATVRRMARYFMRHRPDRKATGFNAGEEGYPSKGRQAWDGWGGDSAVAALRRWLRSIDPDFAANFRRLFPAR
jgi:hypothetical protein